MPLPPWSRARGVDAVIEAWRASGSVRQCISANASFAAVPARRVPFPSGISTALRNALA
jgi:hypothetical protein